MESIKEISFKLFPEIQVDMDSNDWDVIEEQCDREEQRKAFVKGANYVLECIENALNKSFDELSIKDGYLEARKCIEQLKK